MGHRCSVAATLAMGLAAVAGALVGRAGLRRRTPIRFAAGRRSAGTRADGFGRKFWSCAFFQFVRRTRNTP